MKYRSFRWNGESGRFRSELLGIFEDLKEAKWSVEDHDLDCGGFITDSSGHIVEELGGHGWE